MRGRLSGTIRGVARGVSIVLVRRAKRSCDAPLIRRVLLPIALVLAIIGGGVAAGQLRAAGISDGDTFSAVDSAMSAASGR